MEIKEICRTCKYFTLQENENEDEQFNQEPCIACTKNPDYHDCWELEQDIIKSS